MLNNQAAKCSSSKRWGGILLGFLGARVLLQSARTSHLTQCLLSSSQLIVNRLRCKPSSKTSWNSKVILFGSKSLFLYPCICSTLCIFQELFKRPTWRIKSITRIPGPLENGSYSRVKAVPKCPGARRDGHYLLIYYTRVEKLLCHVTFTEYQLPVGAMAQ